MKASRSRPHLALTGRAPPVCQRSSVTSRRSVERLLMGEAWHLAALKQQPHNGDQHVDVNTLLGRLSCSIVQRRDRDHRYVRQLLIALLRATKGAPAGTFVQQDNAGLSTALQIVQRLLRARDRHADETRSFERSSEAVARRLRFVHQQNRMCHEEESCKPAHLSRARKSLETRLFELMSHEWISNIYTRGTIYTGKRKDAPDWTVRPTSEEHPSSQAPEVPSSAFASSLAKRIETRLFQIGHR